MKVGIIGSGAVAQEIAPKMAGLGQEVMISARDTAKKKKTEWGVLPSVDRWVKEHTEKGMKVSGGSFKDAAQFGELLFNCTSGEHSLTALKSAGPKNLDGKILIDLANPLKFRGEEASLVFSNTTSLGEEIQRAFPGARVVKTLNHVAAELMVNPGLVPGGHDLLIAGNDAAAKDRVKNTVLMGWFGWKSVIDLGDLSGARGMEMYLPLWLRLWGVLKTEAFNFKFMTGK